MSPKHAVVVAAVYPWQRVIRTAVLDVIVWAPVVLAAVPQVVDASHVLVDGGVLPASTYTELVAVAAGATAIKVALTRIIALAPVDRILTALGLGTVPRAAARADAVVAVKGTRQALAAIEEQAGR